MGAVGMMVCVGSGLNERIDDVGMLAPDDGGVGFSSGFMASPFMGALLTTPS